MVILMNWFTETGLLTRMIMFAVHAVRKQTVGVSVFHLHDKRCIKISQVLKIKTARFKMSNNSNNTIHINLNVHWKLIHILEFSTLQTQRELNSCLFFIKRFPCHIKSTSETRLQPSLYRHTCTFPDIFQQFGSK